MPINLSKPFAVLCFEGFAKTEKPGSKNGSKSQKQAYLKNINHLKSIN